MLLGWLPQKDGASWYRAIVETCDVSWLAVMTNSYNTIQNECFDIVRIIVDVCECNDTIVSAISPWSRAVKSKCEPQGYRKIYRMVGKLSIWTHRIIISSFFIYERSSILKTWYIRSTFLQPLLPLSKFRNWINGCA